MMNTLDIPLLLLCMLGGAGLTWLMSWLLDVFIFGDLAEVRFDEWVD